MIASCLLLFLSVYSAHYRSNATPVFDLLVNDIERVFIRPKSMQLSRLLCCMLVYCPVVASAFRHAVNIDSSERAEREPYESSARASNN